MSNAFLTLEPQLDFLGFSGFAIQDLLAQTIPQPAQLEEDRQFHSAGREQFLLSTTACTTTSNGFGRAADPKSVHRCHLGNHQRIRLRLSHDR